MSGWGRERMRKCFFLLFCSVLAVSCSQSALEPRTVYARLMFVQAGEEDAVSPRLSLFLSYTNKAGQNDFDQITVVHKATGVTWNLPSERCAFFKNNSFDEYTFLAGTNKMAFPAGKILEGEYIVSISKLNGETKVKTFFIKNSNLPETKFPIKIALSKNEAELTTNETIQKCSVILSGADQQPIFVSEIKTTDFSRIPLDTIISDHKDAHYVQFLFEIGETEFLSQVLELKN